MAIYQINDRKPVIPASCYIAEEAVIIGDAEPRAAYLGYHAGHWEYVRPVVRRYVDDSEGTIAATARGENAFSLCHVSARTAVVRLIRLPIDAMSSTYAAPMR